MASPFRIFRKHQKVMLAGLTILAMFSFVFLGVISDLLGTRQSQNPVIVKTSKYGNLKTSEIGFMRAAHLKVLSVLSKLHAGGVGITDTQYSYKLMENIFGTASDEDLVNTWLKQQRADEIGMVISNDTVNDFIGSISSGKISSQSISTIIKQDGLTTTQFFDALRNELKAFQAGQLFSVSLRGITPAQRWDYFCQLRKEATVQLIPVEAEQFIAGIPDPSEEELKALFEKYKDKLPRPDSAEPGFRIPHKIEVQYFKADLAKFSDPKTITEEEIQNEFEKNRDYYRQMDKEPDISLSPRGKSSTETDKAADSEKKETAPSDEQPKEQPKEQPVPEKKPADQPAPVEEKTPKSDENKSSSIERSPFMLTSMADDTAQPATEEKKTAATTDQPKAETTAPADAQTDADKAAPKAEETIKPAAGDTPESPKRELSERVREKVRQAIAGKKIQENFMKLQQLMEENGKKWRRYHAEKINKKTAVPPAKLDFDDLAQKNNLTAGQTGLISAWDAQKSDIGVSFVEGVSPFALAAFKSATYKSNMSIDTQGNMYLFWNVSEIPEAAPSFEDKEVRAQVLHAWKLIKARELARKEVERLAETARKSGSSLKDAFADLSKYKLITPPAFTMLTEGSVPQASSRTSLRLNEVEGVPMAGLAFMRSVFDLEKGKIGVAMNAPETTAYVVQVEDYTPSQEVLWQIFLTEDFSKYAAVANNDLIADHNTWLESLKIDAGLVWEVKPEQPRKDADSDSMPNEQ